MWLAMGVGLIFSGCTMQKRSLLPGWYIEIVGPNSNVNHTPVQAAMADSEGPQSKGPRVNSETQVIEAADAGEPTAVFESFIPVPARMATPIQQSTRRSFATLNPSVLVSETPSPQNIGFVRFLYFLFGLPLTFLGIICILLTAWDIGFLFLGLVCLIAGIAALKKAFTPRAKWLNPEDNPRADIHAQLKQARKNQQRRRIEERQERRAAQVQVRGEARERRRQRMDAFFQSAYTRMAIGFFGILALYALLF